MSQQSFDAFDVHLRAGMVEGIPRDDISEG